MTKEQSDDENYNNLLVRTQLLVRFARSEKRSMDRVHLFTVEVTSGDDMLDERLPTAGNNYQSW